MCRTPLARVSDGPVCAECWAAVRLLAPRSGNRPRPRVRRPDRVPGLTAIRAAGYYDGTLRRIIHAFKYDRYVSLAPRLGRLMRDRCRAVTDGADACVPVPLHWRRRLDRGFNQASLLARELELPVWYALRRRRATRAQASLHADERHSNVMGVFAARRWMWTVGPGASWLGRQAPVGTAARLRGATLVLVDDVTTTGATLEACARALRAQGARDVRAVTIARVEARAAR
ncbi:MAG: phosphoribosyltransferase family protein [Vicinamibacterales bacterium]|nr:phosphoribosyltransferase family protein [Vicinamibacterales bacterium]